MEPEYQIVRWPLAEALEDEINGLLENGWRLYGPMVIAQDRDGETGELVTWFYQPMVKDYEPAI